MGVFRGRRDIFWALQRTFYSNKTYSNQCRILGKGNSHILLIGGDTYLLIWSKLTWLKLPLANHGLETSDFRQWCSLQKWSKVTQK
jgi:hypothetical protein